MGKEFDIGELTLEFVDEDRGPSSFAAKVIHSGPERRTQPRRKACDRRADLRFEPGKCIERRYRADRRQLCGCHSQQFNSPKLY